MLPKPSIATPFGGPEKLAGKDHVPSSVPVSVYRSICSLLQSAPTNTSPEGEMSTPRGLHRPALLNVPSKVGGGGACAAATRAREAQARIARSREKWRASCRSRRLVSRWRGTAHSFDDGS